jgi:uncharacterized protein (DUF433 family)
MNDARPRQWKYLECRPRSAYRQLFVKGTRIAARTLFGLYRNAEERMTAEEIAATFGLPLESVQEAIAYCESNPPEVAQDFARDEALMEATGMNDPEYKYHGKPRLLSPQERARINRQ